MARTVLVSLGATIATLASAYGDDSPNTLRGEALVAALLELVEQGRPDAQLFLGSLYDTGKLGVPEDDAEAVRWYRLAAEQGLAEAQVNLGVMYDNGEGVPEEDAEAARWYRLAAEQGHPKAQLNVAIQYITGEGVPADHVQAYAWLIAAAAGGDPDAESVRASLAEAMTPEQIAAARELIRELDEPVPQPWLDVVHHAKTGGNELRPYNRVSISCSAPTRAP